MEGKMALKPERPKLYIIAGPNGAGKTTFADKFLPRYADCKQFVNADVIAKGLASFSPESAALRAGRHLLAQIRLYASKLKAQGYSIHLFFLWIPDVKIALARIADRVKRGGHDIPEKVVRRRFHKGLRNLFKLYRPVLDSWTLFDNSGVPPHLVARDKLGKLDIVDQELFDRIWKGAEKT